MVQQALGVKLSPQAQAILQTSDLITSTIKTDLEQASYMGVLADSLFSDVENNITQVQKAADFFAAGFIGYVTDAIISGDFRIISALLDALRNAAKPPEEGGGGEGGNLPGEEGVPGNIPE